MYSIHKPGCDCSEKIAAAADKGSCLHTNQCSVHTSCSATTASGGRYVTVPCCLAALPPGPDVGVRGQPGHAPQEGRGEGGKLDGVATFVTDPPHGYSTTRQNPHIGNHPLYIVVTIELILQLKKTVGFKKVKFFQSLSL